MKITSVESFQVEVPATEEQKRLRCYHRTGVTRIRTDQGITGYGWTAVDAEAVAPLLVGQDPIAVERHVARGLGRHFGAENALWDIVGKAAGQPLHRLLGTCRERIKLYLTTVWPGSPHQTDVTPEQQADDVARFVDQGYGAVKFRVWRPDPMEDVRAVRLMRQRIGGPDRVEIMLDRTGNNAGHNWDFLTGLRVARALEDAGAQWLEEPFDRTDIANHARLRRDVDILITGGEHQPLDVYDDYLRGDAFDIIQPHCANVFLHLRKIAGAAELFGVGCIFHGSHGMNLVGSLQIAATIPSCRMQEIVFTTPPVTPVVAWSPLSVLARSGELFHIEKGEAVIPTAPGLGIDVDEAAVDRYRAS